jgi:formylglycine-generating enzyme required for sulfatase activity
VAHEAIFRRWETLRDWIALEREFLAWRTGLEAARRTWAAAPEGSRNDALLMGLPLAQAQSWLAQRTADIPPAEREFIETSRKMAHRRRMRVQAVVGVLAFGIIAGLSGWLNEAYLAGRWRWYTTIRPWMLSQVRPHVRTAEQERALKPGDTFKECGDDMSCPEMVVLPAGDFTMGSPRSERGHDSSEEPQHKVSLSGPFAVSRFELTFEQWDTCVAYGDCAPGISDSGYGRGRQPVINVSWDDAQHYVAWLSSMTGKHYRLLSEAEWEYAAHAGSITAYSWGDKIGEGNANCDGCGSKWDNRQPAPVGSFLPNSFGLYDMHGNVWEWVEDCLHNDYRGAPDDGSAWTVGGNCNRRAVRGGSWTVEPRSLRSAVHLWDPSSSRFPRLGIRIGRTLTP